MAKSLAAKSRTEKGGKTSAYPPAVTQEIIPGKFNNHDCTTNSDNRGILRNFVVEQDDNDDFCGQILDDVVDSAIDIIYEAYLRKQLIPFTVTQAKDALLQIIEWQFLSRDEGEVETDVGWTEDEEPEACVTDCWAQGSVPKQLVIPSRLATPCECIPEQQEDEAAQQENTEDDCELPPEHTTAEEPEIEGSETGEESLVEEKNETKTITPQPPKSEQEKNETKTITPQPPKSENVGGARRKVRRSPVNSSTLVSDSQQPQATEDQDDDVDLALMQMPLSCQSILKLQAGRPPGHRDIYYDEAGNVVSMTKIQADRLPSHRVQTVFQVVDPAVEAAQTQLDLMRTGRYRRSQKTTKTSPRADCTSQRSTGRSQTTKAQTEQNNAAAPLPPPLLESMNLAPGVVIKEGTRVKRGPKQNSQRTALIAAASRRGLRPLAIRTNISDATVAQLLANSNPVIRPLTAETPPIPPIMPQPPGYAKSSSSSVSAH